MGADGPLDARRRLRSKRCDSRSTKKGLRCSPSNGPASRRASEIGPGASLSGGLPQNTESGIWANKPMIRSPRRCPVSAVVWPKRPAQVEDAPLVERVFADRKDRMDLSRRYPAWHGRGSDWLLATACAGVAALDSQASTTSRSKTRGTHGGSPQTCAVKSPKRAVRANQGNARVLRRWVCSTAVSRGHGRLKLCPECCLPATASTNGVPIKKKAVDTNWWIRLTSTLPAAFVGFCFSTRDLTCAFLKLKS